MPVYTVHQPPLRRDSGEADPTRFELVRDGFSFWAFLLAPVWMLLRRLWLVLLGYLIVVAVLQFALSAMGASRTTMTLVGLLLSILVGLEAATLRRWTLGRRGWKNLGVVVADDLDSAERRFFDAWVAGARSFPAPSAPPVSPARLTSSGPGDVVGLFPQAGTRP